MARATEERFDAEPEAPAISRAQMTEIVVMKIGRYSSGVC